MVIDFLVNIIAGIALLSLGFVSRQAMTQYRTRATRRLWKSSLKNGLTIAITTRVGGGPMSGTRVSFREIRALMALIPTLSRLHVKYDVIESIVSRARQIINKDILLFGGPNSNELTKAALDLLASNVTIDTTGNPPSARLFGRIYEPRYSPDGLMVEETYGLVIRTNNPFTSDPRFSATLVMGLTGIGTAGAARLLVDEHLTRQLPALEASSHFVAVVRVRPVGEDVVVLLEEVRRL